MRNRVKRTRLWHGLDRSDQRRAWAQDEALALDVLADLPPPQMVNRKRVSNWPKLVGVVLLIATLIPIALSVYQLLNRRGPVVIVP